MFFSHFFFILNYLFQVVGLAPPRPPPPGMEYVSIETGRTRTGMVPTYTAVPGNLAHSFQGIIDKSNSNGAKAMILANLSRSNRIRNGGSPPEIMWDWATDQLLFTAAFLQDTTYGENENDRGIAIVHLPTFIRSITSWQGDPYSSLTELELVAEFNNRMCRYDVEISPDLKFLSRQKGWDVNTQVFTYRHNNFHSGGRDDVSLMTSNGRGKTKAFRNPPCVIPGCGKESTKRGHCSGHIPKVSVDILFNLGILIISSSHSFPFPEMPWL